MIEPCKVPRQGRVVRRLPPKLRDDVSSLPECAESLLTCALLGVDHSHITKAQCEVALPTGVARVRLGQTLSNPERRLKARQRRWQIALRNLHVADPLVRHRQVALPTDVARVRLGQTLKDMVRNYFGRTLKNWPAGICR